MTKTNLTVGMMVVTEDGKARVVMPTHSDGLVLIAEDNRALKVSKLADDLSHGEYKPNKTVVKVYGIPNSINGHLFDEQDRELIFDRNAAAIEDNYYEDEDYYDDDCDCDCEEPCENCTCNGFAKSDVQPGMLAVTRDGQNRLAVPTSDMGLVLATPDSKFVRLDKLNDDLTIKDYRKDSKNVDKVYGVASGVTTDFYSEANRPLLFNRNV